MTFKTENHQRGFTIVELMIAIAILVVGLLGMAGLQSTTIRSNTSSKWQTAATTLAEQKLVQLKNSGYVGLANTNWTTVETVTLTGLGTFSRQYRVSDLVAGYLKYVQVHVTWTDMMGVSKQVNLSTYLSKS